MFAFIVRRLLLSIPTLFGVLVVTFLLTVVVDLTVAVQAGLVLAAMLFIKRMADVTNIQVVTRELADGDANGADRQPIGGDA